MGTGTVLLARRIWSVFVLSLQLDAVIRYIQNQQEHHRGTTFREEYLELLKRFDVSHDERYTFQPVQPG
jgi:hypothetical protein